MAPPLNLGHLRALQAPSEDFLKSLPRTVQQMLEGIARLDNLPLDGCSSGGVPVSQSLQDWSTVQLPVERLSEGSGHEDGVGLLGEITPTASDIHLTHTSWFFYEGRDLTEIESIVSGLWQYVQDLHR